MNGHSAALSHSPWQRAVGLLIRDRVGMSALLVVVVFAFIGLGAALGWWATQWSALSGGYYEPMSRTHWFGTNVNGQDIFARAVYSTRVAFEVGLSVALTSTALGAVLGGLAGYFRDTWLDALILWCKGVLDCMPFYLFVAAVAYALKGSDYGMHAAMIATFWTTTGRLVRSEVIRLRELEFVRAARGVGVGSWQILWRHILPNTAPLLLVQGTIVLVTAIKTEVILSFLGLGISDGVSWGRMLSAAAQEVTAGHFNNFIWASVFLFALVMAFNLLADALHDAFDPRALR
ncbi:MAG: ABC transporter permease [Pseudomonadota bacterium]